MTLTESTEFGDAANYQCSVGKNAVHGYEMHVTAQCNGFVARFETQSHDALNRYVFPVIIDWARSGSPNMTLQVLHAVRPLTDEDRLANLMRIDMVPAENLASVRITLPDDAEGYKSWYPITSDPVNPHSLCWDTWNAPECMFPDDAGITIRELQTVVHQFYDLRGASLPTAVTWQEAGDNSW